MYTCPGSIEIASLGTVEWKREKLEGRDRLRYRAIAEDIDFEAVGKSFKLVAFIRSMEDGFAVRVPRKKTMGFEEVFVLPPDTPLSDVIEATLNLLRIGYQPED